MTPCKNSVCKSSYILHFRSQHLSTWLDVTCETNSDKKCIINYTFSPLQSSQHPNLIGSQNKNILYFQTTKFKARWQNTEYRYHLKCNTTTIKYNITKIKPNGCIPPCNIDCPSLGHVTEIKVTQSVILLLMPVVQKLCKCKHGVHTSRMCV